MVISAVDSKQSEESEIDVEDSEETPPPTMMPYTRPTAKEPVAAPKPAEKKIAATKYKPNESEWHPRFTSHVYPAKNYWREQIVIETPGSFNGTKGTYEAKIEDMKQFVFKIPPNDLFNDPHTIHSYQAMKWGRTFGDDSAKAQAFKDSTKTCRKNWSTFRYDLKFKAERSLDIGSVPWIDYAVMEIDGRIVPVLIVELKSVDPIEEEETDDSFALTKNTFVAPTKVRGVDFGKGGTAQDALILEELMKKGIKLSDLMANLGKRGNDGDDNTMRDVGEDVDQGASKHARTATSSDASVFSAFLEE